MEMSYQPYCILKCQITSQYTHVQKISIFAFLRNIAKEYWVGTQVVVYLGTAYRPPTRLAQIIPSIPMFFMFQYIVRSLDNKYNILVLNEVRG